ncbi:MAG: hypothetical protein ABH873_03240 [Candidatus Firestonebacteria bacterium]
MNNNHILKLILIFCLFILGQGYGISEETLTSSQSYVKYGIPFEQERDIVFYQQIELDKNTSGLVVLDIEKKYKINEPMDYTRLRMFKYDDEKKKYELLFSKDDMAGIVINGSNKHLRMKKPISSKEKQSNNNRDKINSNFKIYYSTSDMNKNEIPEFTFIEYTYGSSPGCVTIFEYKDNKINTLFSDNFDIYWEDLDNDVIQELIAIPWFQVGWKADKENKVFYESYECVYKYNSDKNIYDIDKILSKKWWQIKLNKTLNSFLKTHDEVEFQVIIGYYLSLGLNKNALDFFDNEFKNVKIKDNYKLTNEDIAKLRKELANRINQ